MEADGLDFKERLVAERKAPPPLKALVGEGEPAGAPGGAAWAHVRQRLARAEREARTTRRLAIALFGASVAGMAGILRVALPGSATRTAELAARGARMGATPAWAGTARDPHAPAAVPPSTVRAAGQVPSRPSDLAHPPAPPAGTPALGAGSPVAGAPPALALAPVEGVANALNRTAQAFDSGQDSRRASSAVPPAKPAGYPRSGWTGFVPVQTGVSTPGLRPAGAIPGVHPVSRSAAGAAHGRTESSGKPQHSAPSTVHRPPSTASRPPSPVQPRRFRRSVRLSSYRAPGTARRSRSSAPYSAPSRRWRVLRVATRHGVACCLVDPHGHWWVARRVYPRGFRRAGAGR